MKKIFIVLMGVILFVAPAWGDEVDEGLQETASMQIRLSAKQVVQAGVPDGEVVNMTRRMMANRFQEEQVIRAHRIVMAAVKEGIPEGPIMSKAYEGMVKNVPAEAVLQAMEKTRSRYADGYRQAREITRQERQVREIGGLIAEGLAAGINEPDVIRTMEQLRERERTRLKTENRSEALAVETFQTLRSMARLGTSSRAAADVVCQALAQRFNEREMNMLQHAFMTRSKETAPEMLAHQYAKAIGDGERAQDLGRGSSENERGGAMGGHGGSGMGGQGDSGGSGGSDGSGGSGGSSGGSGGGSGGSDGMGGR